MILIGTYRSPFTRRVAISLRVFAIAYEQRAVTAWSHFSDVSAHNPLGQIPVLVLDDGQCLYDSTNILDYLDERVGPERALVPAFGSLRRQTMSTVALALGVIEKSRILLFERHLRPAHLRYQPWIERWCLQIKSGLGALNDAKRDVWFVGDQMTQADITAGVMYDFVERLHPDLLPVGSYPQLDAHAAACRETGVFQATMPEPEEDANQRDSQ